jgi:cell division protein FtsB
MKNTLRTAGYVVGAGLLCAFALLALRGPQGVTALNEKRRDIQQLQVKNSDLQRDNQHKRERIERLRSSQAEQEMEIRERLKLVRPNETQFILPDAPKSTSPAVQ